ncbi:uncharacterized protein LOC122722629 isoform X2 [Manihot esculenta]|uniref:uncharacterized protein LOC122722629 isoform X1 n=1 Tax=Manihot esculenta TaxID=3983 RepID=UPI001CC7EC0B|nr:uncharacterized protein LOC122722629 isoform X1 [Manihot esculenta]XP_043809678.1 uncharacterized protein LOC122722629 isoform X2 [Manihot esculenta]
MECQGATGGSSCGAGSWLANGQLADSWLASGRGWPAGVVGQRSVVGLRIRLAYGAGWPTDTVGLRKTGWPTDLSQARSNWRNGLEDARSFQKQLGRAGSCQKVLVGQRKFQGSLVGLRKFQKAPERASSAQNWPETARTAQNWPELPRSFQNLVGQQIQPSKWVPQATQPPCPEFSTGCEITKKSLKVLERQS